MVFVDIKNDIAFRKIFGNDEKTAPLISFFSSDKLNIGNAAQTSFIFSIYNFKASL